MKTKLNVANVDFVCKKNNFFLYLNDLSPMITFGEDSINLEAILTASPYTH